MYKEILIGEDARKAIKRGVDVVADAVKITIGPKGRNVAIDNSGEDGEITNDGVSAAEASMPLKDKFENAGAKKARSVARKVNSLVGDSTSTGVVLFQAFLGEGMKSATTGLSVIGIRDAMIQAAKVVGDEIKGMSKKIKTQAELRQVAITSAESVEMGNVIADTIQKIGKDGAVTVEESSTFGISSDVVEGMQFDQGYISDFMVTHKVKKEAEYRNVMVLVTDYKISFFTQIAPLLDKVNSSGKKELVIIADDMEADALFGCRINKGAFNILVVKAPGYGGRKKEQLEDIATVLGANFISSEAGSKLEDIQISDLGYVSKIVSQKEKTTIIGGSGKSSTVRARIKELKEQKKTAKEYEIENIQQRIGKMSNGVAVIKVGASTETEMIYLKKKIEDAVNATKSADEGIVIGGGVALVRAAQAVRKKIGQFTSAESNIGYSIVLNGCEEPLRQIAVNADKGDGSIIVETVKKYTGSYGYNALKDSFVLDMFKEGIIDSAKAMRTALEVAVGDAAILLTVGRLIVEIPDETKNNGLKLHN